MRKVSGSKRRLIVVSTRVFTVGLFLFLWEVGARRGWVDPFFISTPLEILKKMYQWISTGFIFPHMAITLIETLAGFLLGIAVGMLLGFSLAFWRKMDRLLLPFLVAFNAMPRVVFYPLFVLWFGMGLYSKIFFSFTLVFFIIFFNTYSGLKQVDKDLLNNAKVLGGSGFDLIRHVYLPSVMGWVFSSLRVSVGFALIGAIVGEYLGAKYGIGQVIAFSESMFSANEVLAGLFVLMSLIALIYAALRRVEARFGAWRL
ncbi:MAG: ABC transporter permease [Desulfobacteraceae bacterium]|jgi:NitT/TauT family transport system permease protein